MEVVFSAISAFLAICDRVEREIKKKRKKRKRDAEMDASGKTE